MKYTKVTIIFNPKSTGPSETYAKKLKFDLEKKYPNLDISLQPTKYAGHAEKIAYEAALASKSPLIISSSGDGGYNEVINGAIKAQNKGARPVCAVLPAGNANDHRRTLGHNSLLKSIKLKNEQNIDLLKMTVEHEGQTYIRYAHSYIGLGLTPVAAAELNKTDLNALKEFWIVLKAFYKYRPFKILHGNKYLNLDSIIFTNIPKMAKVLTLAKNSRVDDGLFEVITFAHARKLSLLTKLLKASIRGLKKPKQYKNYRFTVIKDMPAQLDGEVLKLNKKSVITIRSENKILRTLL